MPFDKLGGAERGAWTQLLAASHAAQWAFLAPAYADAVNATVGPVEVLLCWDHDVLAGVMPLQRAAGWLGRCGLRVPVGREMTDYFGLLAQPGIRVHWHELLQMARVPAMYFTHLDESQAAHGLTGDSATIGLRTRLPPGGGRVWWEQVRLRNRKFAGDTERRERKLAAAHGALTFALDSGEPARDLEAIVTLKNAQYQRTGHRRGALLNPANVRLLQRLLQSREPNCMPRLSVLRCGGELVAGHFGLQCGTTLHYWFPVYDPTFAHFSPGRILYRRLLLDAATDGITCIDRGAGDTAAKRAFANEEHRFFKGLVYAGVAGRGVSLLQRARWYVG